MIKNLKSTFVIITSGRTGSTLLRLWLNDLENIRCHGEVFNTGYNSKDGFREFCNHKKTKQFLYKLHFNKKTRWFIKPIIKKLIIQFLQSLIHNPEHSAPWTSTQTWNDFKVQDTNKNVQSVGFKLPYYQFFQFKYLDDWMHINNVKIIHLIRENVLKQYLSGKAVKERKGVYHSEMKHNDVSIFLNADTIFNELNQIKSEVDYFKQKYSEDKNYLEIEYEDFIKNTEEVFYKIREFLEISSEEFKEFRLKKLNSDNVETLITNYKEIKERLKGSQFEKYFFENK